MDVIKIMKMKGKEKIVMITAYDAPSARIAWEAGVDIILVGDSLGNNVLGYKDTIPVTMEEMLIHVSAVRRGAEEAFIVADMPFLSYQVSESEAIKNAGLFLKSGANAVKLEGGGRVCGVDKEIGRFWNTGYGSSRTDTTVSERLWWLQGTGKNRRE